MYKVILIDDEPLARQLISNLLHAFPEMNVVASCTDGFDGFKSIQEHKPDLIFLDVQMPRLTGFEMLELLDNPPATIFTTAFDEYAVKAFETHAVDYLLKPIVRERFEKAVKKWLGQTQKAAPPVQSLFESAQPEGYQHRIVVKDRGLIRIIPAQEIFYVEACDDYLKIYSKEGHYLKKGTLNGLEQTLDPHQFVRVHRSYFIPVNQLLRIEPYEKDGHIALLHCGAKVQVSKTGMGKLKSLLGW